MASNQSNHAPGDAATKDDALPMVKPPILSRLSYAMTSSLMKGLVAPGGWYQEWMDYFYPPTDGPNFVKTYESRPRLPVRIFFPSSHDQTSPAQLPTLFTIHGGGFVLGLARDDDEWNRAFADMHGLLVVALEYAKAPWSPFPTAVYDVEALLLAVLADESLPIDRRRTAVLGFSAGGNLALAACQLDSIRGLGNLAVAAAPPPPHPTAAADHRRHRSALARAAPPAAAISIYGPTDLSLPPASKAATRPYKRELTGPRGGGADVLGGLASVFDWSYVPYGQDLRDPLLSPAFAGRDRLPPWLFFLGAELDMLAHEGWRTASRFAGRAHVPGPAERVGREAVAPGPAGRLDATGDARFGWDERDARRGGGVRWLLVPDQVHGFDHHDLCARFNDAEGQVDAKLKTTAYQKVLGQWLKEAVWA